MSSMSREQQEHVHAAGAEQHVHAESIAVRR
jgi:hypothetical protein